jgi:hypothetical protein
MNAYNLLARLKQSREAGISDLLDPGSGGTVNVTKDLGVLVIDSTGSRTLQAAAQVAPGVRVLVLVTASGVDVNSVAIGDGEFAEFVRGLNSSGAGEWKVASTTDVAGLDARVTTLEGEVDALQSLPVNAQTGTSYTLQASDAGKIVTFDNGSAVTVTVPTTLAAGFQCKLIQLGAGLVTVQGDGTMVVNTESAALTLNAQHGAAEIAVYAADLSNFHTYDISGS